MHSPIDPSYSNARERSFGTGLALFGWLFIAALTLVPNPSGVERAAETPFSCLVCGDIGGMDVILNVALFLPLGLGLGLRRVRPGTALLLIAGTTGTVEFLQWLVITGRDASLSDLLTNTVGGGLGLWLASRWRMVVLPDARSSTRLAVVALGCWLAVWTAAGFLLQPSPPAEPWWGQLAPTGVTPADYAGTIVSASVDGVGIRDGRLPSAAALMSGLATARQQVEVQAVAGDRTPDLASLFGLLNQRHEEALLIGQDGRALIFRIRRRSADFRLRTPMIALADGAGLPGRPLEVHAAIDGPVMTLSATQDGATASFGLALSASLGWVLLQPADLPLGAMSGLITLLWLGGTLLPAGYWTGRAEGAWRRRLGILSFLIVGAGLWGVAAIAGCAPGTIPEAAAALLGLFLGSRAGRASTTGTT